MLGSALVCSEVLGLSCELMESVRSDEREEAIVDDDMRRSDELWEDFWIGEV